MRIHFPLVALLATLSACNSSPSDQEQASNRAVNTATVDANATNMTNATSTPADGLRFIGRWAAAPNLCTDGAWNFTERGLETAGEVYCEFEHIEAVPEGYDIDAMCTTEGDEQKEQLRLRLGADAKAMKVETKRVLGPVDLAPCGAP
ncbi:hypothetical protein [Sphingomonas sp. C3-2]|uniref:hypothetical protein n=1 Tax=Sphingomonas sp. C3-2 TaxID=3062169 RepID=UPI00294B4B87|nr:hypothetical protein [Sphingomonas sp. C3-2]WOK36936.1 hypothetical protein QYC26_01695 [Sphingomonas sp. C3-2]